MGYKLGYGREPVPGIAYPIAIPGPAPPVNSIPRHPIAVPARANEVDSIPRPGRSPFSPKRLRGYGATDVASMTAPLSS